MAVIVAVVNAKTDLFLNFGEYFPALKEKAPEVPEV